MRTAQIYALLFLLGIAARAQSQQRSSAPIQDSTQNSPQNSIQDSALPDAPQAAAPIQAQVPDQAIPQTIQQAIQQAIQIEQPITGDGSIHGVVTDRAGAVYEGVHVTLKSTNSAEPPKTTQTDANGRFQFTGIPPGSWQLTVSSEGFATQAVALMLHPGENFEPPAIVLPFATATSQVEVTASQLEVAQAQLKDEEEQRVFGVIPNFYVVYAPNAPPLNPRQKFHLAWRSSIDPVTFLAAGFFAGVGQAADQYGGYGQGAQGYAKRFGANYADSFIGTMIGSAILPSLLKQDPRYFSKGVGSTRSRVLYALANSVMCKGDSGRWQVNYSGILGSMAAGGISNLYYPAADRNGWSLTFENLLIGTAGTAAQNLFQEFLIRKLTPKLPNYTPSKP